MSDRCDIQLIGAAHEGDEDAFNELVKRYERRVLARIRSYGVPQPDCEDVAQETWKKVWEGLWAPGSSTGTYKPDEAGFYTWVVKCNARHCIRDWFRQQTRFPRTFATGLDDETDFPVEPPVNPDVPPEERLWLQMTATIALFRLFWRCGGYPHEQIACAFAKLLYGGESERGNEGVPQRVDQEHGQEWLDALLDRWWVNFVAVAGIDDSPAMGSLRQGMEPVHIRLKSRVGELIQPLQPHMRGQENKIVAHTCLRDYYPSQKQEDRAGEIRQISDWCYHIQQKMRQVLGLPCGAEMDRIVDSLGHDESEWPVDARTCSKCKLRFVKACKPRQTAGARKKSQEKSNKKPKKR